MALFVILVLGYTASWLTFGLLTRAFRSEAMKEYIISADSQRGVDVHTLHRSVRVNTVVSMRLHVRMRLRASPTSSSTRATSRSGASRWRSSW